LPELSIPVTMRDHPGTPPSTIRVAFVAVGCRTNQEEAATLRAELASAGFAIADNTDHADIVIVNTCTVTGSTEARIRRTIRSIHRQHPDVRILVTGCLAQQRPKELASEPGVRWVVGNRHKSEIPRIIGGPGGVFYSGFQPSPDESLEVADAVEAPDSAARTRFPLKIQEGCNYQCAYCIVPSVRGPSRCADASQIVRAATRALDIGYHELVLTGTHIGQFRHADCLDLSALLQRLVALDGDFRIRLSSVDPRDISERLVAMVGSHPRVCRHLHVSVQSLSDAVLTAMHRSDISAARIVEELAALRARHPDVAIGGDFIAGFPGETLEMFRQTLDNVLSIGFAYGHVFRFSPRPGTPAASMGDTVDEAEKSRRSEALRALIRETRAGFVRSVVGTRQRMVVEQESPVQGLTSNYLRLGIAGVTRPRNSWCDVTIRTFDPDTDTCTGELRQGDH